MQNQVVLEGMDLEWIQYYPTLISLHGGMKQIWNDLSIVYGDYFFGERGDR